ncbi:hypothetical protein SAMN04488561_1899 [Jiangella alba]|uniref:Uncharacterized protein n=1 Tax=Jiangella alba TaxID=561176 RepID=A0A1H5K615_9ACTN|nr:hypothetical protein SAMN04488561_1899 [Jiangella alba]
MLLLLIAVPVVILATFAQRLLQACAPSNVLIRCVRTSRPTIGAAAALCALALGCVAAVHAISLAIATGAPGWLNLVVLVLAWDAIKFFGMVAVLSLRLLRILGRPLDGRGSGTSRRYRAGPIRRSISESLRCRRLHSIDGAPSSPQAMVKLSTGTAFA